MQVSRNLYKLLFSQIDIKMLTLMSALMFIVGKNGINSIIVEKSVEGFQGRYWQTHIKVWGMQNERVVL